MGISDKTLGIRQNMIWNMVGSAIGMACQWLISIIVVRLAADLSSAGLYSLAMSVFAIFAPIAHFGMYTYIVTDMDDRHTSGEYITLVSATSMAAIVITSIYALITCRPNAFPVILAYSLYKSLATVIDTMHAVDQKGHRMDFVGISLGIQGGASLIAFTLVFHFTQNLTAAVLAMAACTLAVGLLYDLPRTNWIAHISLGISGSCALGILGGCLLIVLASIAMGAAVSIPRQTLSQLMGDANLGIYASVATPVAIVQVFSTYIYNPLIGYFAESYHARDRKGFLRLTAATVLGIALVGALSLAGAIYLGRPLLNILYGSEVAAHSDLLGLLIASSVLLGVAGFLSNLLVAVRAMRVMAIGSAFALALSVVSAHPLVTAFGMNGVTLSLLIASLGSIAVSCAGICMQARSRFSSLAKTRQGR